MLDFFMIIKICFYIFREWEAGNISQVFHFCNFPNPYGYKYLDLVNIVLLFFICEIGMCI